MNAAIGKFPLIPLMTVILLLAVSLGALPIEVHAQCSVCTTLKRSKIIAIKRTKQYLNRAGELRVIKNQRLAKAQGYTKFTACANATNAVKARGIPCAPVFGIVAEKKYLCPAQLKGFKSASRALTAGYERYAACITETPTPTPTATPQVTPLPSTYTFTAETGQRFINVDSLSIVSQDGGAYRAIVGPSASSFDPDTIRYSDSVDGLSFGAFSAVTGIAPLISETFANPGVLRLQDGSYLMLYEKIKHISSAATDLVTLLRAVSNDAAIFTNNPTTPAIPGGSVVATNFGASLVQVNESTIRLYYSTSQLVRTTTTTDNGINWSDDQAASILGRSTEYAPFPFDVSVVINQSGTYLMFFVSPPNESINRYSIYLAQSTDGVTYQIYDQSVLAPPDESSFTDPNAVVLPDGSIRLYYIERAGEFGSQTRTVKSGIVQ